jgi:hypothetical protein
MLSHPKKVAVLMVPRVKAARKGLTPVRNNAGRIDLRRVHRSKVAVRVPKVPARISRPVLAPACLCNPVLVVRVVLQVGFLTRS